MAEDYLKEHDQRHKDILLAKKRELADLDADLEDFMHVATDGAYNIKQLNDAFEGKAHENEEIEIIKEGDEFQVKKRTKRPPKPDTKNKELSAIKEEIPMPKVTDPKI